MAILGFELEEVARLIALMEAQGLDEIVYQEGDRYLRIRGPRSPKAARSAAYAPLETPPDPAQRAIGPPPKSGKRGEKKKAEPAAPPADQITLASPMVGVFYRSSQPGTPSFVEIGQTVTLKQPIGMIEAMKVFSVIEAEHAGVVVSIPAQDGKLVQAGEPLMILRK